MQIVRTLVRVAALCAAMLLVACAKPVPPPASYVGDWRAENVQLAISAAGDVHYLRVHGRWADGSNGQPKSHLPYQLKLSKPPVCSVWIIYRSNDWAGTPFNYIGFVREHDFSAPLGFTFPRGFHASGVRFTRLTDIRRVIWP